VSDGVTENAVFLVEDVPSRPVEVLVLMEHKKVSTSSSERWIRDSSGWEFREGDRIESSD
jgi:hypothetical protein